MAGTALQTVVPSEDRCPREVPLTRGPPPPRLRLLQVPEPARRAVCHDRESARSPHNDQRLANSPVHGELLVQAAEL